MNLLKSCLRWFFGVITLASALTCYDILCGRIGQAALYTSWYGQLIAAIAAVGAGVFGMAWWTNGRRQRGSLASRIWGGVASALMLLSALPLALFRGGTATAALPALLGVVAPGRSWTCCLPNGRSRLSK